MATYANCSTFFLSFQYITRRAIQWRKCFTKGTVVNLLLDTRTITRFFLTVYARASVIWMPPKGMTQNELSKRKKNSHDVISHSQTWFLLWKAPRKGLIYEEVVRKFVHLLCVLTLWSEYFLFVIFESPFSISLRSFFFCFCYFQFTLKPESAFTWSRKQEQAPNKRFISFFSRTSIHVFQETHVLRVFKSKLAFARLCIGFFTIETRANKWLHSTRFSSHCSVAEVSIDSLKSRK